MVTVKVLEVSRPAESRKISENEPEPEAPGTGVSTRRCVAASTSAVKRSGLSFTTAQETREGSLASSGSEYFVARKIVVESAPSAMIGSIPTRRGGGFAGGGVRRREKWRGEGLSSPSIANGARSSHQAALLGMTTVGSGRSAGGVFAG